MSEVLADLRGVSRVYQKGKERVEVLHELDLVIPAGDFLAIMGPSGSGKTTLLNLLGGLDGPSSGTVTVGGAELSSMSNNQLSHWRSTNVGFVFQFYNLLPVLTAQKNVELPLLLTSFSAKERAERAAIALDIVGLCDEPTGDLDREKADEILKLLQILNRDHGKTIVMVTHDAQAADYATRILHVDKGKLESRAAA